MFEGRQRSFKYETVGLDGGMMTTEIFNTKQKERILPLDRGE